MFRQYLNKYSGYEYKLFKTKYKHIRVCRPYICLRILAIMRMSILIYTCLCMYLHKAYILLVRIQILLSDSYNVRFHSINSSIEKNNYYIRTLRYIAAVHLNSLIIQSVCICVRVYVCVCVCVCVCVNE